MKESLQREIAANSDLPDDADLSEEARKFVKMEWNQVYNPAIATAEVAEELGVSEEEAHNALEESPHVQKKAVGNTHIWW